MSSSKSSNFHPTYTSWILATHHKKCKSLLHYSFCQTGKSILLAEILQSRRDRHLAGYQRKWRKASGSLAHIFLP